MGAAYVDGGMLSFFHAVPSRVGSGVSVAQNRVNGSDEHYQIAVLVQTLSSGMNKKSLANGKQFGGTYGTTTSGINLVSCHILEFVVSLGSVLLHREVSEAIHFQTRLTLHAKSLNLKM